MNPLRTHTPLALLAATAALGIGACGGGGGAADGDPAAIVPERAVLYLEATVRPEGDLKENFESVAGKLAETDDPGGEIKKLINREAKEEEPDFDFDEDIDPWLGDTAAFFFTALRAEDPDGAAVVAVSDTGAAQEWLSKELRTDNDDGSKAKVVERSYKEVDYEVDTNGNTAAAVVEDFAVLGSEAGLKAAIDAADGSTLAESEDFETAREEVSGDGLAFGYARMSQLFSGLGPQGAAARQVFAGLGDTVAFALDVEEDAIRVESAALGSEGGESAGAGELLGELPGESWLAAGSADIGGQLEKALGQVSQLGALGGTNVDQVLAQIEQQTGLNVREDLLAWMGDAGIFMTGTSPAELGGALVVQSTDPDATREALPKLERLLSSAGVQTESLAEGVDEGFTVRVPQMPLPVHVGLADDRFVVAVTDQALEQATGTSETLADSQAFTDASGNLEEGVEPTLFIEMAPVIELLDGSGAIEGAEAERARRVLEHFTTIIGGGQREGDVARGQVVAGVK